MSQTQSITTNTQHWPALPYDSWRDTYATLHMWTQIIGKIRLTLTPDINHWWQTSLYITSRGLTTSPIPYEQGIFEIHLDFIDHNLFIVTSEGGKKALPLVPHSVADFYHDLLNSLKALGIDVHINPRPQEIPNPIPCDQDTTHCSYDPIPAHNHWRILVQIEKVLRIYRSQFIGKSSPIHFFWGSFDLALSFFSGKPAPLRPNAGIITRDAYSHEVISCGFWPGNAQFPHPAFYSYTIPTPPDLHQTPIQPNQAYFNQNLGEFILLYDDMRPTPNPAQTLLSFFQSTLEAGMQTAHWDRTTLLKT